MTGPGGEDRPPKKLGRGLSEVSHVFLSAAENRKNADLQAEGLARARDRRERASEETQGGGPSPAKAGEDESGLRRPTDLAVQQRAKDDREAEAVTADERAAADDDLWLPRATYISVTSGERVRGKTLLAGNLAYGFFARGRKIALVNADCDRPDILDVTGGRRSGARGKVAATADGFGGIAALDAMECLEASEGAGDKKSPGRARETALLEALEQAGREAQIVIVDTSPWADHSRWIWRIAALSIVISEPESDRMRAAYVTIKRIRAASAAARIGLVLNCVRSYAEGEECFRKLAEVSRRFLKTNIRNYGYVPHDTVVSEAYQTATPLVRAFPDSKAAKCVEAILGLIMMDESAIARRRREVTYEECALRKGRLQALRS